MRNAAPLLAAMRIALRRLWIGRRLAAAMLAGFTVVVGVAFSIPLFSLGALQRVLEAELAAAQHQRPLGIHLAHFEDAQRTTTFAQYEALDGWVRQDAPRLIGVQTGPLVHYGALAPTRARPVEPERVEPRERWLSLAFLSDLVDRITLVDGRLPASGPLPDGTYEALVEEAMLDTQRLTVGARFWVPLSSREGAERIEVQVVGAFERTNPQDPYWFQRAPLDRHLLLPEETFRERILTKQGVRVGQFSWYFSLAPESLSLPDLSRFRRDLLQLEARALQRMPDTELFESPVGLLTGYERRSAQLMQFLLILSVPLLSVVLYFLSMTTRTWVEAQRQEIAVLRSRGASGGLIGLMHLIEALTLGGLALLLGYPLGRLLALALGSASSFLVFVLRRPTPILHGSEVWGYALIAVLGAILTYVIPALLAARQSIVSFKQSASREGRWQRWAGWVFGLGCLVVAGYGYYTLERAPVRPGAQWMDPLQVTAPVLFILGAALWVAQLIPGLIGLLSRLVGALAPPALYLPLVRLSRTATAYRPMLVLLILTVGTGLYSAVAARTVERNTVDQIRYRGGADLVIDEVFEPVNVPDPNRPGESRIVGYIPPPWEVHRELPGVQAAARVRSQEVSVNIGSRIGARGRLMAIDPWDFGLVAWFRSDLAPPHPNHYLNLLAAEPEGVLVSRPFMQRNRMQVGDQVTLIDQEAKQSTLRIVGIIDYWPTYLPQEGDFFIANLDQIEVDFGTQPYRVWLKLEPGATVTPVIETLQEQGVPVLHAADMRSSVIRERRRPELQAYLGGLSNSFMLSLILTLLGFWLYTMISVRSRVVQLGALRAMGLSPGELNLTLFVEQAVLVLTGVGGGTLLGYGAASTFLPLLQQAGLSQTPPFLLFMSPTDSQRLYLILLGMVVASAAGLTIFLRRLSTHEALKLGEDH